MITEELKSLEEKILGSEEKINKIEYDIFMEIIEKISKQTKLIQNTAMKIALLDCINSLSISASSNSYSRPKIDDTKDIIFRFYETKRGISIEAVDQGNRRSSFFNYDASVMLVGGISTIIRVPMRFPDALDIF